MVHHHQPQQTGNPRLCMVLSTVQKHTSVIVWTHSWLVITVRLFFHLFSPTKPKKQRRTRPRTLPRPRRQSRSQTKPTHRTRPRHRPRTALPQMEHALPHLTSPTIHRPRTRLMVQRAKRTSHLPARHLNAHRLGHLSMDDRGARTDGGEGCNVWRSYRVHIPKHAEVNPTRRLRTLVSTSKTEFGRCVSA